MRPAGYTCLAPRPLLWALSLSSAAILRWASKSKLQTDTQAQSGELSMACATNASLKVSASKSLSNATLITWSSLYIA